MEFHTLTRRELQALCKKNKIPANITNAGMIEALKALDTVEGIDELVQTSQSETQKSSLDSLEGGLEVTSPYVPPTGGRTTRRRNVMKEELEAVTTTRRATRKTAAKASHVDITETPAIMSQTRRKRQMASACRKMDSQFNKCVEEEEKKDVSMTPAPMGTASRKGRKEVGTVQKAYSTRRSVRLAEKNMDIFNVERSEESEFVNNVVLSKDGENHENEESELVTNELLGKDGENEESEESGLVTNELLGKDGENEESEESELVTNELVAEDGENQESEESELVTNELVAEDGENQKSEESEVVTNELLESENQEVNLEDDHEPSGITGGVEAIINVENYEKKEKSEVVSAEVLEGESCIGYAEEAEQDEELSNNVKFDVGENSIEPEKFEVVPAEVVDLTHEGESFIEFAAETAQVDKEISKFPEVLEGESCIGYAEETQSDEEISDNVEFDGGQNSIEPENFEVVVPAEVVDLSHEGESCIGYAEEAQSDEEISDNVEFDGGENSIEPENFEVVPAEVVDLSHEGESCTEFSSEAAPVDEEISEFPYPVEPLNASDEVEQIEGPVEVCTSETETTVQNSEELDVEIDLVGDSVESKDKIAVDDDAESCDEVEQDAKETCPESVQDFNVAIVKLTELRLQQEDVEVVTDDDIEEAKSDEMGTLKEADEKNSPSKQQVLSGAVVHTAPIISDNKENIGSGTELVIKKERNTKADKDGGVKLNELSLRKLTKMFKEKLDFTKKSSNELSGEELPRAALQPKN